MSERIVITGYGGISAIGHTVEEIWQAILDQRSGLAPSMHLSDQEVAYPYVGEIKNYQPRHMVSDRKILRVLSRQDVLGLYAADQAINHSELTSYRDQLTSSERIVFNESTGIYVGSPGNKFKQQYDFMPLFTAAQGDMQRFGDELFNTVHPMWLLKILPNNVLAYTGITHGFKGASHNITNHAVGGMQAILEALFALRERQINRAVVVGYDSECEPQDIMYYRGLDLLSETEISPFDHQRQGTLLGEGAGALILETMSSARDRGAKIYGEVLGGHTVSEAMGIFSLRQDGDGLDRAMTTTLNRAQVRAEEVGMITAHGNGTIHSDASESRVLARHFGKTPVSAFKWALGHTLCAAGVLETVLTLIALKEETVPGIATLQRQGADCAGIAVSQESQATQSNTALVVSRAFGSLNSCLLLRSGCA